MEILVLLPIVQPYSMKNRGIIILKVGIKMMLDIVAMRQLSALAKRNLISRRQLWEMSAWYGKVDVQ